MNLRSPHSSLLEHKNAWLVFGAILALCVALGGILGSTPDAAAAPAPASHSQGTTTFVGPEVCGACHKELVELWQETRHAHAFSSPIFQRDWEAGGSITTCLECHTTGYDKTNGSYAHEGVTCESCHGAFQQGHPTTLMPVTPNAELCRTCHQSTTDEWMASPHAAANIQCQACHNPHSQEPRAESVTALCTNCHKEMGDVFAHGTHAEKGVECSNCHMYTAPRTDDAIMGLIPTGHTFTVGSEACIGCHMDTVHTRDTIVNLSNQVSGQPEIDAKVLEAKITEQEAVITELKTEGSVRLYTGLAQGAIVGLITGGVAAWVVSRRLRVIEVEE
jgi:predicted CXXCH cytochrome family protein